MNLRAIAARSIPALLAAATLSGCGIITVVPAGGAQHGERGERKALSGGAYWADVDERTYPGTMALLKTADDALAAQRFDDALAAVRQSRDKLHEEYEQKPLKDVVVSEAHERVWLQQLLFEGQALHGAGRDMDALLAIGANTFDFSGCRQDLRPRCQEHAEWLVKTFPGVAHGPSFLKLVSASDVSFNADLNVLTMNVSEREIQAKKGWAGVIIEPTSKKDVKDGVTLRVDGRTSHDSYEDCNKVGEVRIGGSDFNVEKCHQQGYVAQRADFFATVPAEDAKKVTGAQGEQVFLIFEVKNWKKNGKTYTTGPARVAWVSTPKSQ